MKILIVYYSMYGHVFQMARAVEKGVQSVADAEVLFRRVEEFPENLAHIRESDHARPVWEEQEEIPVCSLDDLQTADGILFGTPTRFGNMAAQMKRFIDSTAQLWLEGALEGKPAGIFTSTATAHGGQETTSLTFMVPLLHLGMLIVGVPYSTPGMLHTEGRGGTPYGASTLAGSQNQLKPAPEDLEIATAQGRRVALVASKLKPT
jgi:NAD(P)H dehydrogenase (quinone)